MARIVDGLEKGMLAIAVFCVAAMMVIVAYDSVARYVFSAPLPWSIDLISYYLLVTAIYFAVSATFTHGDHINLDLFRPKMSRRALAIADIFSGVLAAGVFALLTYAAFNVVHESYVEAKFLPGWIIWPAWLSHLPIVLGSAVMTLRLVYHVEVLATKGADVHVETHASEPLE